MMHEELANHEARALDEAHRALSAVVHRFESAAYALPGPVPIETRAAYWDALREAFALALPPYVGPNTVVPTTPGYRVYLAGLRELATESMAAFPTVVGPDEATDAPDWTVPAHWTTGGAA